jgi:hypothetical protein
VIELVFAERQRFLNTQASTPQDDDHRAHARAVPVVCGVAHHGNGLLHGGRVGRVAHPLVARRATGVIPGQRRRRATAPRRVEH